MADPDNGGRRTQDPPNASDDISIEQRFEQLDAKLDQLRGTPIAYDPAARDRSALSQGLRIASEFVASILVGGIIGWQLDKWLNTSPVLLIIFFLLGTAAGLRSVMRAANALSDTTETSADEDSKTGKGPGST